MRLLFFILMTGMLFGCSKSKTPKGILPPEKMQEVYWDFIKADVFANEFVRKDSTKKPEMENAKLQLAIFKAHHISRDQFYKSYRYYLDNEQLMKAMIDTMLVRQEQKKAKKLMGDSLLLKNNKAQILDTLKME